VRRYSTVKHEHHGGNIDALAGGSPAHSVGAGNIVTLLDRDPVRSGVRGSGGRWA
jgi:hypothetical protein